MKTDTVRPRWYIWLAVAVIGIVLLAVVFFTSTNSDISVTQTHLADTVNYVRKQCSTYTSLNLASETKSLLRVMECTQQISRNIQTDRRTESWTLPEAQTLARYADELYLSGILLLEPSGSVAASYDPEGQAMDWLGEEITKHVVLDTVVHPEKTYSSRLDCGDGSYVDMAACGRLDSPGVIVAFYHTPLAYVDSYSLSFQNLLSGYSVENDGTIAVTKGDIVVASNDESIIGLMTEEVPTLQNIRARAVNGQLVHVRSGNTSVNQSFGVIDRGRDYYVYAYLDERSVFESTPRKLLFALIGYAFALILLQFVEWRMLQNYRAQQREREQVYQQQLMESARKAESANIAKTEFLQRMSHDIRTPINGIRGLVEIGDYYQDDPQKQAECRRKIWDASGLLLELVNEVLDMGKLESGEIVLESRPFNLPSLLDGLGVTMERSAAERGITIERKARQLPHPNLIGSPLHIKRLLMNLLSNAVKYNKDNGKIMLSCCEVRCEQQMAWIEFICADTGIGMSEEFQKHLYEPFTQENGNVRSTYGGTGLGMAITKSLVDKMGGTIVCVSEQNVGTTYTVTIPLQICTEAVQPEVAAQPQADENSLQGMRILLVEDNDLNMEIAMFLLKNAGAELETAYDGE